MIFEKKKSRSSLPPGRGAAASVIRLGVTLRTLPQLAYFQGWGVFKGGTWATPKPYMPRTMCSFQLQVPEGIPLTPSSPVIDSTSQKMLFIELGQGVAKRVWFSRWNVQTVT